MKHAVKVRVYPTNEQQVALSKAFGCARWFWNNSLALTNQLYKETGKGLSQQGMNDRLPVLKKEFEVHPLHVKIRPKYWELAT